MVSANRDVVERVQNYIRENLSPRFEPDSALVFLGGSQKTRDGHIYLVMAKETGTGNYGCWTCWNDKVCDLYFGHYDLSYEEAVSILEEFEPILDGQERFILIDNNGDDSPTQFANKTQLLKFAASTLEYFFQTKSDYGNPVRGILKYVSSDMAEKILEDYGYTVTRGTEEDFKRIKEEYEADVLSR